MNNLDKIYEEANIEEKNNRIYFEISGVKFFINKDVGLMRRRKKSASMLQFLSDEIGMAEGKYDNAIEAFLSGIIINGDSKRMVGSDVSIDEFYMELPEVEDDKFPQMEMMELLPYVSAVAVMGKPQVSALLARAETSISANQKENLEENTEGSTPPQ